MWDTKVFTLFASAIIFWTSTDVVQGRFIYHSELNRWVQQDKVVATWEQAKVHCESEGAVLASPIKEDLLQYMTSLVGVDNHESPYFIGMKLIQDSNTYRSIEGTLLDDLPEAIINKIDKLDPREGDCLGMSRNNIHVVPCYARLPYLCYINTNSTIYEPTTTPPHLTPGWIPSLENNSTHEKTCGSGYEHHFAGSCYKVHDEYTSWDDALSTCSGEGAYLAIINDVNEAEYLKSIAFQADETYIRKWIGLREKGGRWRSVHDQNSDQIFNVWSNTVSGFECGALKHDGLLDDQSCTFNYRFICEKSQQGTSDIVSTYSPSTDTYRTSTPSSLCDFGYEFHAGSCYKVHDEYKSWDEAQFICSNENAYLTVVNSESEAKYLKSIISRPNDDYIRKWIGHRKIHDEWRSIHGEHFSQIFNIWSSSADGLPCGVLKNDGLLDDQTCGFKYRFICEKGVQGTSTPNTYKFIHLHEPSSTSEPPTMTTEINTTTYQPPRCISGYEFHAGSCYKVHDEYKSWDEAQSTCSNENAYLTVVNDESEANYLKSIISRPNDDYIRKWIGLRKIHDEWRSIHGDHFSQIFNIWSSSADGLPCGVLKNDGLLDDQTCGFKYRFICEKGVQGTSTPNTYKFIHLHEPSSTSEPPTMTTEINTTTYQPPRCISGYEFYSGSCYKVHDEYETWDDAKSTCAGEGGYLAIIDNADEATVLQSISSRPNDEYRRKWIGLHEEFGAWRDIHDNPIEDIFNVWSDSVSGLPCGAFKDDGLLDDQSCEFKYRFICENHPYF